MSAKVNKVVKLSREEVYRANAVKAGYVWSWDNVVGRYKLVAKDKLVGWFKTLREVKSQITELRFVAKGNLPKFYRDAGYTTSLEWSGLPEKTHRLEFRGEYIGNFTSIDKAIEKAREHDVNRWERQFKAIGAMWSKAV